MTRLDNEKEKEVFPVGTILKGNFFEYAFNKHFLRDEYIKIHLYEAELADGTVQKIDNNIKVRPRVFINTRH